MSDLIRCPSCKGVKKIIGLGYIKKDCPTCDGVGSIVKPLKADPAVAEIVEEKAIAPEAEIIAPKKNKVASGNKKSK